MMFGFLKHSRRNIKTTDNRKDDNGSVTIGAGIAATDSAQNSIRKAAEDFAKPAQYDRSVYDDAGAKIRVKQEAFCSGMEVKDCYTGETLTMTIDEAKSKYGDEWAKHVAETDHIISLKERAEQTRNNPWLKTKDVKASSNSKENLEVVSKKYNNAKRERSNTEFVEDEEYLKQTGVQLSDEGKALAKTHEAEARKYFRHQDFKDAARNIVETGHNAGKAAAQNSAITGLTMSGIMNLTAVIKGEKTVDEALKDTAIDGGKAALSGYAMGGGLTIASHTLSASSSEFLKALSASNIPGTVITAVMTTGNTLRRFGEGEITTQQCLVELGNKGVNLVTGGYSMAVGQALIPVPIVGAAVGAVVGSIITSNYYNRLISTLQEKDLEHQERLRIISECEQASNEMRSFRAELEQYLEVYFRDYQDCFDDALSIIHTSFETGDTLGIITGANQITRKLGGRVYYNTMEEFESFIFSEETDVL